MKRFAVILLLAAVSVSGQAQEPEIKPAFELTVQTLDVIHVIFERLDKIEAAFKKLTPDQLVHFGEELNRMAVFEARVLGGLTRHKTSPENYLWVQIRKIRETAKTDPEKAQAMIDAVVEQFKRFGVTL